MNITFFGVQGGVQSATSGNVSFVVGNRDSLIQFECSGSPMSAYLRSDLDPSLLEVLVVSHFHIDHVYGLPSLIHNLWLTNRKNKLTVISNTFGLKKIKDLLRVYGLLEKPDMFPIEFENIEDGHFDSSVYRLDFFEVEHSTPTFGAVITIDGVRVIYSSDTAPFKGMFEKSMFESDLLIHEASGCDTDRIQLNLQGHSTGRQAGEIAGKLRARKLFLCHLPQAVGESDEVVAEARAAFGNLVTSPELYRDYVIEREAPEVILSSEQ